MIKSITRMWHSLYGQLKDANPSYGVTIFIALIAFASNFAIERIMDYRKTYESSISELRGASGEFVALGGEFTLPIIQKEKPDSDIRSELGKNIMKQITIANEIEGRLSPENKELAVKYVEELKKTKILIDKTNNFDQLQALYQRYSATRSSWKRLEKVL